MVTAREGDFKLKEPSPIFLTFSQAFGDFGIIIKLIFILISPGKFYS